jgi:DNA gyrase/topoisomerase IV subunit A
MSGKEFESMEPWWQGFEGIIYKLSEYNYEIFGTSETKNNKLIITELPVGTWTSNYKEYLEKLLNPGDVKEDDKKKKGKVDKKKVKKDEKSNPFLGYTDNNTDTKVHFELSFEDGYLDTTKDIDKFK